MNLVLDNCQLEWNRREGILYVHNKDTGTTVVRVQGLPVARDSAELGPGQIIDVRTDDQHASVPVQ